MKLTKIVAVLYIAAITVTIIAFTMLIRIMDISEEKWANIAGMSSRDQSESKNGNEKDTSFVAFAKRIRRFGDVLQNVTFDIKNQVVNRNTPKDDKLVRKFCRVPKTTVLYPLCDDKVKFVHRNWKFRCYAEENNIDNRDICSILIYLSEIEKWCPRLPWRETSSSLKEKQSMKQKTKVRSNVDDIIKKYLNDSNHYNWMQIRIKSMEKDWKTAILSLSRKRNLSSRSKKKVLIFVGAFFASPDLFGQASSGEPLGELMVQWSDLITSLYLLGHDVTFTKNNKELKRFIPQPDGNGCINKDLLQEFNFDLLYTDIAGAQFIISVVGPYFSRISCKLRVLDSFGTEAEFNYGKFSRTNKMYNTNWGELNLNLRQFMTMFPHSPDNSFLGFVSGSKESVLKRREKVSKKNKGLVYGKLDYFWEVENKNYLDEIHKYIEIHGTIGETKSKRAKYIPEYVINHGVVNGTTIQNILIESKVFVGLGFPYEGPAPLQAVANGAAFLNPQFSPPLNKYNSPFFKEKPTRRLIASQNTYMEKFIGQPYVYTIDKKNLTDVEITMRKIMNITLKPYLPYEFTHEGMLERISAQVENLDFCQDSRWPPLRNMVTVQGILGQSCAEACWGKGLLCEPSYWNILNILISFNRAGITCDDIAYVEVAVAPSYDKKTRTCYFQQQPLLYSCVSSHPSHIRLCPCRDFIKGQVALCKRCW